MIELENIHVTFNQGSALENKVLMGINLSVPSGQFLTIIGSNGAGKSTILNTVAGLVRPQQGHIKIAGRDVTYLTAHKRAKSVSRVFQDPKTGTCEELTILENYALARARTKPRHWRFAVNRSIREEAGQRLSLLKIGLENRLDDRVGLLSGGQRQAVSLVMATAGATDEATAGVAAGATQRLLLDEHTAALDPKNAAFIMEMTRSIVDQFGLSAMMVTHSMAHALEFGHRTIMLHRGRIVVDVADEKRAALGVDDLIELFKNDNIVDDALMLG